MFDLLSFVEQEYLRHGYKKAIQTLKGTILQSLESRIKSSINQRFPNLPLEINNDLKCIMFSRCIPLTYAKSIAKPSSPQKLFRRYVWDNSPPSRKVEKEWYKWVVLSLHIPDLVYWSVVTTNKQTAFHFKILKKIISEIIFDVNLDFG